ncbi:MAG TPA: bifunctional UDP-N-acetylglucosamine diphosphorylase/glucosamine-1-phosphate N-acetyltransferase GlmU [Terriglobia bacterium]|nr:bifunctional UDP-N-acetylglucosamine diphosphorylase/glucosamine-1-phosphate N-acetyltransferase GlmU [Terriglobia bacterium]
MVRQASSVRPTPRGSAGSSGFSVLILAAGKSIRFKSEQSKLLHLIAGRPLGEYILRTALDSGPERAYMVVGAKAQEVKEAFTRPGLTFIDQKQQRGTGHALLVARPELERCPSRTLVALVGDAPLLEPETLRALIELREREGCAATILTTRLDQPRGYGRIMRAGANRVRAIVEEKVATPTQKKIREISSGILAFDRQALLAHLDELSPNNAQKEYLLTDLVAIFSHHRLKVTAFAVADSRQVLGVNDRVELAEVERILRRRKAMSLMREGVTIVHPEATYIDDAVEVGPDTVIEPGVSLLGRTRVGRACVLHPCSTIADSALGDRVTVRPCSVITGCEISSDVAVGPFAHLRDGAVIETSARIGNFVEVKKSRVGRGSRVLHLTYLGDSTLGEQVNVGAGTVTCNYDGVKKHPTVIESGAFIGSGSMLVAPIRIGRGAYVAAGSTISKNVPAGALAFGRARQVNKEGWMKNHGKAKSVNASAAGPSGEPDDSDRASSDPGRPNRR